jgi:GNAT superfamily N-acetyltransferase
MTDSIVALSADDRAAVLSVINAAAEQYSGVIPEESDTDPYMSATELEAAMEAMQFYGFVRDELDGVIGIQERADVSLVRHLYVRPGAQRTGIGTALLEWGVGRADSSTILVGTWAAAEWAIEFYRENGFELLGTDHDLLSEYWNVPEHQRAHSVVLRYVDRS